jgi:hypothetical protein
MVWGVSMFLRQLLRILDAIGIGSIGSAGAVPGASMESIFEFIEVVQTVLW